MLQSCNKMTELEQRQDQLLQKLDTLYERIQTISSRCSDVETVKGAKSKNKQVCFIPYIFV